MESKYTRIHVYSLDETQQAQKHPKARWETPTPTYVLPRCVHPLLAAVGQINYTAIPYSRDGPHEHRLGRVESLANDERPQHPISEAKEETLRSESSGTAVYLSSLSEQLVSATWRGENKAERKKRQTHTFKYSLHSTKLA